MKCSLQRHRERHQAGIHREVDAAEDRQQQQQAHRAERSRHQRLAAGHRREQVRRHPRRDCRRGRIEQDALR
jgi:hypothetical protein